jgi:hypothetical protein
VPHILALALVLHIHNLSAAPPSIVHDAQDEVVRLYDAIGVHIETTDQDDVDSAAAIDVILIPDATGDLRRARDAVMGATVWTLHGTPIVYVFYRRVQVESDRYASSVIQVLACTLAHELGHVLLPDRGHAPDGLMRASWGRDDLQRAEQGQLRFLPTDAARIRAGLLKASIEDERGDRARQ